MRRHTHALAAAAMVIGLVSSACSNSPTPNTTTDKTSATTTATTTASPAATTTTTGRTDLQSLIPTPADTQRTDGPDSVSENGIHTHFLVNGSPSQVMDAYKTALEGKGWSLTTENSGGGATYTGTNGNAYGVFTGGGYAATTDIDACAWPSKPSNTHCGHD